MEGFCHACSTTVLSGYSRTDSTACVLWGSCRIRVLVFVSIVVVCWIQLRIDNHVVVCCVQPRIRFSEVAEGFC